MPFASYSPVLLFCYNRKLVLEKTVASLIKNVGAEKTDLYIFSDGPKNPEDVTIISELREYLKSITGFKSTTILESEINNGLAKSIINGVSKILEIHDSVIVLEDDLLTSKNFLGYMNQCLELYKNKSRVFSISGYSPPIKRSKNYTYDAYFFPRNSSHGWATWNNRWKEVNWEVPDFESFIKNKSERAKFNIGGSDLSRMLQRQMEGKVNSWSIRFCYHQYKTGTYTVYPVISKIQNIGFGPGATHTNTYNRYHTPIDMRENLHFELPEDVILDENFIGKFREFYSLKSRGIGKVKTLLYKAGLLKNK